MAADEILEIPLGYWSAYGFVGETLAIPMTMGIEVTGGEVYKELVVELVEGGRVAIEAGGVRNGQQLVLYFPPFGDFSELTVPVPGGASSVIVPRNREFLPILMQGNTVIAIGRTQAIGNSGTVAIPKAKPGFFNVIVTPLVSRATVHAVRDAEPHRRPTVRLLQDGLEIYRHDFTTLSPPDLAVFADLPFTRSSTFEVEMGGDQWSRSRMSLAPAGGATVVLDGTMEAFPVSTMAVRVTPSLRQTRIGCVADEPSATRLLVLNCTSTVQPGQRAEEINAKLCSLTRDVAVAEDDSVNSIENLRSGWYLVDLRASEHSLGQQLVHLPVGEAVDLEFGFPAGNNVSGRVSYESGASANAEVRIGGKRAGTDPHTGEYSIAISRAEAARVPFVLVRECESGRETVVILEDQLDAQSRLDVTLLSLRRTVLVSDAVTGDPVSDARASLAVSPRLMDTSFRREPRPVERIPSGSTDPRGELVLSSVQPPSATELCVEHADYEQECIKLTDGQARVTVKLLRRASRVGKIVVHGSIEVGRVAWIRDGLETETVPVGASGAFRYDQLHGVDEMLVFVSRSHPLFVLPWSVDGVLTLPIVPTATFTIRAPGEASAMVALEVGGALVPDHLFALHQSVRGDQPVLTGGGPLRVADIAALAAIVVVKGPSPTSPEIAAFSGIDIFSLPQYRRSLPRRTVVGPEVTFDSR